MGTFLSRLRRNGHRAASIAAHGPASAPPRSTISHRIPSWNCIARENSSSSLDDELCSPTVTNHHTDHVTHDGDDSEPEPWTRSRGPPMRTVSADMFVDIFTTLSVEMKRRPTTPPLVPAGHHLLDQGR